MSITLYDIPSTAPGRTLSPNVFKARIALTSFKTEWLETPDIEPKMKEIGAEPTAVKEDGSPFYTLPVIHDHSTGRIVSDSMRIARYLEETYPDKPSLFPHGAVAPIMMFDSFFFPTAIAPGIELVVHGSLKRCTPVSAEFIRKARGKDLMARVDELEQPGPRREALLAGLKDGFSKIAKILLANGEGATFFYGKTMSYADVIVIAHVLWMKRSFGPDSYEWKEVEKWDVGLWGKLVNSTEKYHGLEL
ncbi:hypothetical protein SCHPADRAFT_900006 [Schizopora paradoxa]|uniref:GST N-terminal domain-containing protein n=1 Tax=Schizopora paradoxa TaxID=27342 RepID=A0A0H2S1Z7_9AGAM|nr:hypothetical protein SCHPADRAFT_900006 [Schizopora paradoxa]